MKKESGQILVLVVATLGVVLFTVLFVIAGSQAYFQNSNYSVQAEKASALAEAGIDKALNSLNKTGGSYNGEETVLGDGSYSVTVTDKGSGTKALQVTGYIPNKDNPKVKRTIKVDAFNGIGTAFNYAIQIGEGGLKMDENSQVIGSVYSNGNVKLDADARITGDVWVAGGTAAGADQSTDCQTCIDYFFGRNISGQDRLDVAQSFKPAVSQVINKVGLKIKKIGNPPNVTVRILRDQDGRPDEDHVVASGTLSAGTVTSSYPPGFVEVSFSQTGTLQAGNTYWIMIDTSSNYSNYWSWSADMAQSYTRGSASWSPRWNESHPDWYSANLDLGFQTFMGGVATYIDGDYEHHNSTFIGGDAHANTLRDLTIQKGAFYQIKNHISYASDHPNSTDPLPQSFPISEGNIAQWKQQAQDSGIFTGNINNCPLTLPAGKYVGTIRLPYNCHTTIVSPVWITGDLDVQERVQIKLDSGFGPSSGVMMVDGFIELDKDSQAIGSGTPGSYLILLSNFNSRDDNEHRYAINVKREGNTGVLYSNLGSIRLSKDNHITSITGWKVNATRDVIIEYDQGLAGTFFSFGPSGSYSLVKGTYQAK